MPMVMSTIRKQIPQIVIILEDRHMAASPFYMTNSLLDRTLITVCDPREKDHGKVVKKHKNGRTPVKLPNVVDI